jgi:hypothetical protein
MALVAAIGAATTTSMTAPLSPAHAASVVRATPAAATGAQTMTFHAHAPAAATGKISPFANPLDITCNLQVIEPFAQGGPADSAVLAAAVIDCFFDVDGSFADVDIDLTNALSFGTPIVDTKNVVTHDHHAFVGTSAAPCLNGTWTSGASVRVTFPLGFTPPTAFASAAAPKTFNFGDCPSNFVEVPDVIGETLTNARIDLTNAGLEENVLGSTPSCEVRKFDIATQSPEAGHLVLRGSTVDLRQSSGLPPRPCE